ncbi:hypothetical protein H2198_009199 [Neophaeococcomyces mojaviensis]|uniref:Uncharacterized protein n=1 Tax=Neophaeococcomyces mojaviensis TaxID=3383035 RepID=A0ACC2ZVB1_9EURO|nr:hypothetical protein H2198_009199 [Knufia sp. JES_112]
MISSAVVIPEVVQEQGQPQSPTLKRKFSPTRENDSKRPKIDTDIPANGEQIQSAEPRSAVSLPKQVSPARRRSSALGVDEKKRNQRLFGSLLGTLSQTTAKPAHRKRDEIEARQRERLKRQNEEQEEERQRKKEELRIRRDKGQKLWEEEGRSMRHANMRAVAGFLQTKAEPALYYKPWELREKEEETIRRQKEETERQIRRELGEDYDVNVDTEPQPSSRNFQELRRDEEVEAGQDATRDTGAERENVDRQKETSQPPPPPPPPQSESHGESDEPQPGPVAVTLMTGEAERHDGQDDRHKDDDQHGEELVEGQEDDVIY